MESNLIIILSFFIISSLLVVFYYIITNILYRISKWSYLEKYYPCLKKPKKMNYFKSGVINGICINGLLNLSISQRHLYLSFAIFRRKFKPLCIPIKEIEITDQKKHFRYHILNLRCNEKNLHTNYNIGLDKNWMDRIKTHKDRSKKFN